jgi:signal peptidase I
VAADSPLSADTWAISPSRPLRRPVRRHGLVGFGIVLVIAAALAIVLRLFVVQTFFVPTGSMIPTLQVGDRMLVVKIGYSVTRGSIVVFRQPPDDTADVNHEDLVKRVIGLPGETIWSRGNNIYIDGRVLAQPWLPKGTPLGTPIPRQTIPKGEYFMMGDNRPFSDDSRDWGDLPASLIVGKVLVVIWRDGRPAFHIQ